LVWLVGWLVTWLVSYLFSSCLFFKVVTLHIVIFYSFIMTEMFKSCAVCVGTLFYHRALASYFPSSHLPYKSSTCNEQPICEPKQNISNNFFKYGE
jgi:hypothetical protein